jgi:hypothetical protein
VQLDLTFPAIFGFWFVAVALSQGQARLAVMCCAPFAIFLFWLVWQVCKNVSGDADTIALDGVQFAGVALIGMAAGHRTQTLFKACRHAARSQPVAVLIPASTVLLPEPPMVLAASLAVARRSVRHPDYADGLDRRTPGTRRAHVSRVAFVRPVMVSPLSRTGMPKKLAAPAAFNAQ